ncbi:GNAT family N-acetyltransferase [Sphingobium rhizovicinum]|uniref:GNAT family N-acetyltransferase n=1 Tax=Sphingobium rhizovicinum TaxID=432308 RepID=A0ABV7NPG3_9SPHN|nr:GNAT family N-acetyltransferase [Sphingobium baderi]EZP70648.1 putative acetyltransferase [Sphingomonas paucimobilis]WRD77106.1 N-acetyltransferase family protein [Sphingobium baderi]
MTLSVRKATVDDARAIAAIYAHHVLHGTATYEVVPPTEDETVEKILTVSGRGWPFLVACDGDQVVGYAYATQFRDRPAYAYACENSIYVAHDRRGGGIGKLLLKALLEAAEAHGFRRMVAVIGGAEPASVALHGSCGFEHAGRLTGMGWKAGRWLDTVYMQIALGRGISTAPIAPGKD